MRFLKSEFNKDDWYNYSKSCWDYETSTDWYVVAPLTAGNMLYKEHMITFSS